MTSHLNEQTISRGRDHRPSARAEAERVVELAAHLAERDRLLIEQIYLHGLTAAQVARLVNISPRRVQRRVAGLLRRMRDPLFQMVAHRHDLLPTQTRSVARAVVLQGESLRGVAARCGLTLHEVRCRMQTVRVYARLF